MEHPIHESFFSSKSRSTFSSSLQALSQSTYNTYKSIRHNFFDILGRRPSSSFNNPYFYRGKSFRKEAGKYCACSSFLTNYKLNYSTFVGSANFPKTHGCESLTVICVLLARSLRWWKKKNPLGIVRATLFLPTSIYFTFLLLKHSIFTHSFRCKNCIVTTAFESHL